MKLYPITIDTASNISILIDIVDGEVKIIVSDDISEIELNPDQVERTADMLLLAKRKSEQLHKSITELLGF